LTGNKVFKIFKEMNKKFLYAVSLISGTIIGVGLFSLPYIASRSGIWTMLGYFAVLGILAAVIHRFFGELALKTPDFKRLPGFALIYIGKWGRAAALISMILGLFGALLAYLIVGGAFFQELLSPYFGGGSLIYTLIYFSIGASFIYFGIKAVSKMEFWAVMFILAILVIMFFKFKMNDCFDPGNLVLKPESGSFFLPYGAVLFSLWGASVVPEAEELLLGKKGLLGKAILIAILLPVIVYLFFIFLILGITGSKTTEFALVGLREVLGEGEVILALVFGLLATFTSFVALGMTLKKVFWYDLRIGKKTSWAVACFAPLLFFLAGFQNFIAAISFAGGVAIGLEGILILLMYRKIKEGWAKKITYPLMFFFGLGIIFELIYLLK
jgi:tyrosine-specific transport protein